MTKRVAYTKSRFIEIAASQRRRRASWHAFACFCHCAKEASLKDYRHSYKSKTCERRTDDVMQ